MSSVPEVRISMYQLEESPSVASLPCSATDGQHNDKSSARRSRRPDVVLYSAKPSRKMSASNAKQSENIVRNEQTETVNRQQSCKQQGSKKEKAATDNRKHLSIDKRSDSTTNNKQLEKMSGHSSDGKEQLEKVSGHSSDGKEQLEKVSGHSSNGKVSSADKSGKVRKKRPEQPRYVPKSGKNGIAIEQAEMKSKEHTGCSMRLESRDDTQNMVHKQECADNTLTLNVVKDNQNSECVANSKVEHISGHVKGRSTRRKERGKVIRRVPAAASKRDPSSDSDMSAVLVTNDQLSFSEYSDKSLQSPSARLSSLVKSEAGGVVRQSNPPISRSKLSELEDRVAELATDTRGEKLESSKGRLKVSRSPRKEQRQGDSDANRKLYDPYSEDHDSTRPSRILSKASKVSSDVQHSASQQRYLGDGDYVYPPSLTDDQQLKVVFPAYSLPGTSQSFSLYGHSVQQAPYLAPEKCYHRCDYPLPPSAMPPPSKLSKVASRIEELLPFERQLSAIISARQYTQETLGHIERQRLMVRDKILGILPLDLEYSVQHSVDILLWKSVYHQLLEGIRSQLSAANSESADRLHAHVSAILDEADHTYSGLLTSLERQHDLDISSFSLPHRPHVSSRHQKLALVLAQRCLICLGDVARYRTQMTSSVSVSPDYGKARKFYLQASHVAPKNGKPYNQLALVALYSKRKLDTVFYFMRSISASNAFLSARESLRAIYNDIIKKYKELRAETERRRQAYIKKNSAFTRGREDDYHKRVELWISPIDGSSTTDHVDDLLDVDNPRKMSCNELYKRLMVSFLASQGFLFSKVGMEHFPEASSQVLHQLDALISHSPIPFVDTNKLIQMFAIAMFSIQSSSTFIEGVGLDTEEQCRSYTQEQAVLLYIDMTTVIVNRCTILLSSVNQPLREGSTNQLLTHDLSLLLPVVKLATDWMTCHPHLWNPPPCPRDPLLGPVLDPWFSLAQLANALSQIPGLSQHQFYSDTDYDNTVSQLSPLQDNPYTQLTFLEEEQLRGFLPLMNLANENVFTKRDHPDSSQVEGAALVYRASRIMTFADYLCGIEPAMLDFNTSTSQYRSIVEPPSVSEQQPVSGDRLPHVSDTQETHSHSDGGSAPSSEDEGVSGVSELRKTKRLLTKQLAQQQRQHFHFQNVIKTESSHRLLRLEIRPIFVIPDTNCFIEYPQQMQALITSLKFTVVVPLVVINELDGLARGSALTPSSQSTTSHSLEHSGNVARAASDAVEFLESQFDSRNRRLKALTATGTEMHTITYRSEQDASPGGNNDDRILSCCLHYCKDNARDYMPRNSDNSLLLFRDVVLLTDDRNLRLKAHTRNVPVKDLLRFLEWASIRLS